MIQVLKSFKKDNLLVKIFQNEQEVSFAAAEYVADKLNNAIHIKGSASLILATGNSQIIFLEALKRKLIDWQKISVFHLDEYKHFSDQHPASFRKYLKERLFEHVKPGKVYLIKGDAHNLEEEMANYERLLKHETIDIACIGIGENGHIAFNDPPVADFNDPHWVKLAKLDEACRRQQFGEGWFSSLEDVPYEGITLTIPAIMHCKYISCLVPGQKRKAKAVYDTLNKDIGTDCPATILRKHLNACLFLDEDASSLLVE